MKKIILSGIIGCLSISSLYANEEIKNCKESDRAIRSVSMMGMGAFAGGVGAPIGLALGSIAHDYECDLNWFEKKKPIVETKKVENKIVIEEKKEHINKTFEIKKERIIRVDKLAEFNKNSSKPKVLHKDILVNDKIESITLIGHTSTDGSTKYNQNLSEKRALNTKKAISKLVDPKKIKTIGKGKSINKYSKFYENQRVEAEIKYK